MWTLPYNRLLLCCCLVMRSAVIVLPFLVVQDVAGFVPVSNSLVRARNGLSSRHACGAISMKLAQVPFRKYQGLGNDFILVDNREADEPLLTAEESSRLCDR